MESIKAGDRVGACERLDTIERIEGEYAYFVGGGGWRIERMAARIKNGEWFVIPAATLSPAPSLSADERQHALDTARHVLGHENTTPREDALAQGLLAERAEGDRLGSLLDSVIAFAALRAGDNPGRVLAEVRSFIATHRVAK